MQCKREETVGFPRERGFDLAACRALEGTGDPSQGFVGDAKRRLSRTTPLSAWMRGREGFLLGESNNLGLVFRGEDGKKKTNKKAVAIGIELELGGSALTRGSLK